MAIPIVQSVGSSSGAGTAGQGRNNLVLLETVTLSDTEVANAALPHFTEFMDVPIGSALTVLTNEATATPSFIPDVTGSYRIRMIVNGYQTSTEVLAVPLTNTGARIPSFQELVEYDGGGNAKGWHEALTVFMRAVDADVGVASLHHLTHLRGGTDEVDGDRLDIDFTPSNYTPSVAPAEVTHLDHLSAHLAGLDDQFGHTPGDAGEMIHSVLWAGLTATHDSATPLVVAQVALNPGTFRLARATRSLIFSAVAANAGGVAQTMARLYNLTDGEYVGTGLTFTTASPAKQAEILTIGAGAGEVDESEKIYEVHIWVVAPDGIDDTIELGGAKLQITNTIS